MRGYFLRESAAPAASNAIPRSRGQCNAMRAEPKRPHLSIAAPGDELAGDQDPDRRRDPDSRSCVGHGEDDQQAHDAA